jgi:site-specific recombinase XerD
MTERDILVQALPSGLTATLADRSAVIDAFRNFFDGKLRCANTRRAYERSASSFFEYAAQRLAILSIDQIKPYHISAWLDAMLGQGLSAPTVKQRLAALNGLFESLLAQRIIGSNPAKLVQGPRHIISKGRTPVLSGDEVVQLLNAIDACTLIGKRDRAMIGVMAYSFARISAVTSLKVEHIFHQKRRLWLRLREKGGKAKDIPCHHQLEAYLDDWLDAARLRLHPDAPLFQTFARCGNRTARAPAFASEESADLATHKNIRPLSGKPMTQAMTWEMLQRRKKSAGLDTAICNHTFRATGITAYLINGGAIERAANIAGHASINTTKIYDRRSDDVTLDEIEKIRFA